MYIENHKLLKIALLVNFKVDLMIQEQKQCD